MINLEREIGKNLTVEELARLQHKQNVDFDRRLKGAGSSNVTVVVGSGSSSSSGGTSASTEMRVGRATVAAGSVVVSFAGGAMSTSDYELFFYYKEDGTGAWQPIDSVGATKSISGFTIDTFAAGTLIYAAIPRQ